MNDFKRLSGVWSRRVDARSIARFISSLHAGGPMSRCRPSPAIDAMPHGCFSCLTPPSARSVTPPPHELERHEPATSLAEDFARARQAAVQAGVAADALPPLATQASARHGGVFREPAALAPIPLGRRSSAPAAPSRPSSVDAPVFSIDMFTGMGADRAQHIFDMLWQDVAIPALHALGTPPASDGWRDQLEQLRREWSGLPHEPTSHAAHPWHDTLHAHLHRHARMLAHHGFDVADVADRLETLLCEQRPGFSWRSFYIGTLRDALPFAIGSTLVSLLAESTDPTRSQAWLWPPLAALGVVLINLLGMAGFNVTHSALRNRIARTTPAPGLEGLSAVLSTPYRAAFAQVLGFVFCYGILRNGARYGIERAVSRLSPHIFTRRFGDTLHAALEVPLAPIPGLLLLPIIHQLGTTRQSASLQILAQNNFSELIDAAGHAPARGDRRTNQAFFHDLCAMLRSTPPKLIWFALTVTFYYLAWMGDYAAHAHSSSDTPSLDNDPYARNATLPTSSPHSPSRGEEAHVFAVLDILYGVIGLIFSLSHTAAQREDIRTAHERRTPQPKISTSTFDTAPDSGMSSGSTSPTQFDCPSSPGTHEMNNNTMMETSFAFPAPRSPHSPPLDAGQSHDDGPPTPPRTASGRRHGTTTVPGTLCRPKDLPWWGRSASDDSDDDVQQSTPL